MPAVRIVADGGDACNFGDVFTLCGESFFLFKYVFRSEIFKNILMNSGGLFSVYWGFICGVKNDTFLIIFFLGTEFNELILMPKKVPRLKKLAGKRSISSTDFHHFPF
jgi:hypothetical protein